MFTVSRALKWWVWEHPERLAINYDGEEITYAELYAWSSRVAAKLRTSGVQPGQRVSAFAANSLEYAVLLLGVMLAGGISAPVSFRCTPRELRRNFAVLTPTLLFVDDERRAIAQEALGA